MYDFMVTFPSETIRVILEYLNKNEHVKCMLVCKRWYERIPDYVSHLWSHLVIASKNWPKTSDCFLRCIGPHTQNVNIDDAPICSVLRTLKSRECNIAVLELKCYHRFVKDGPELVAAITQFGSTLKELHIINITTPDIFEHILLDSCPNLTHLTLLFANLGTDAPYPPSDIDATNFRRTDSRLVYLHIDNEINFEYRGTAILRRCPILESLIVSNHPYRPFYRTYLSGHFFNSIFESCPRLRYVSWNEDNGIRSDNPLYQSWRQSAGKAEGDGEARILYGLVFQGTMEEMVKVVPVLERSQQTLGYLKLLGLGNGIAPVDGLQFDGMKTLILNGLKMNQDRWVPFLTGCQSLENLSLETSLKTEDLAGIIRGIHCSNHLRHLCLHCPRFILGDNQTLDMFGMLSSSSIRSLSIHDIPISDQGLLDICDLLSLRELEIAMQRYGNRVTTAGLLAFAEKLASVNSELHSLSLAWFANLTDTVLEQLAHVKSLTTLSISFSGQITYAGVEALVSKSKKISTSYCPFLSKGLRRK